MSTRGFLAPMPGNKLGLNESFQDWDAGSPRPGQSLWQSCPLLAILCDPQLAFMVFDDFTGLTKAADNWIATANVTGTATQGVLAGGTGNLNAGAVTANQGIQIQKAGGYFIPAVGKHIWFEARFKVNVLTGQYLVGLWDIDTTLVSGGALHATDGIGLKSLTGDGVVLPETGSASSYTVGTTTNTLATATYVKLGFTVTDNTSVQFYVNGVAAGAPVTTNIPSVVLTPSFVCQANGTGTPQMDLDFVFAVQLR